jgi:hypothetical protein
LKDLADHPAQDTGAAKRTGRVLVRAASIAAALTGVMVGFDFGHRVDGVLLGVVAAANLGVLAAILAGAAADWVFKRAPARRRRD